MNRSNSESLQKELSALQTLDDLAQFLDIPLGHLNYLLFVQTDEQRYKTFRISKKNRPGEYRQIASPRPPLKQVQQHLSKVLQSVYHQKMRNCVHGFVPERSIVSNAEQHTGKCWILNIDIKDFFPSITFPRVRGLLVNPPYYINHSIATIIARICCLPDAPHSIPQGAPTSPVISNMICRVMDSEIIAFIQKINNKERGCRLWYTRYADDITISGNKDLIPPMIGFEESEQTGDRTRFKVGEELENIIRGNGFEINARKIRLLKKTRRQEVTGLTVNNGRLNVNKGLLNQIRAMLHAWEKYGYEQAEMEFLLKFDHKPRNPRKQEATYQQVVRGKIEFLGMVRGKSDKMYLRLLEQYSRLLDSAHTSGVNVADCFEFSVDGLAHFNPHFGKPFDRKYVDGDALLLTAINNSTVNNAERENDTLSRELCKNVIEPTLKKMGYQLSYSGEVNQAPEKLMKSVWSAICAAKLIVAISPGNDADIYYQMGIAHTLGKKVILLVRRDEQVPLDLIDPSTYIHYENSDIGKKQLRYTLRETVELIAPDISTDAHKILVKPQFGSPLLTTSYSSDVFLLMPFRPEFHVLHKSILDVTKNMYLTASRSHNFSTHHDVIVDIWSAICSAKVVIADCTYRDPDVFYLLGIAHTIGVRTVLLTQLADDIPSIWRNSQFLAYTGTPSGRLKLQGRLRQHLENIFRMQ